MSCRFRHLVFGENPNNLEASFSIDSKTEGVNEITTTTKEENADASPDVPSWAIVD